LKRLKRGKDLLRQNEFLQRRCGEKQLDARCEIELPCLGQLLTTLESPQRGPRLRAPNSIDRPAGKAKSGQRDLSL